MNNNEEMKSLGTSNENASPAVDTSYMDISLTTQNLLYTLNLDNNQAIQNFAINSSMIFTTQRNKDEIILAKSDISGTTATQDNSVNVNNAGHGQTLEYITKGPAINSLLFSFHSLNGWSTEIGLLDLSKFNTTSSCDSSEFKRFVDLEYATSLNVSAATSITRADAALSSDQSTILIWTRSKERDTFTGYDFYTFCSELSNSASNTVSFKNNKYMKEACKFCFTADTSRMLGVPTSFQGIELSNESNGVYSIYVVSGNENSAESQKATNRIYRITSNGVLKKAGRFIHPYFNPGVKYEIEGVKISGDNLLFGLVRTGTGVNKKNPFIMKIPKSTMQ